MKKAISAQNTKMYLENLNAAPIATGTITSASQSAPCYVVFGDVSKLKPGMPLYITGTGWASLDNQEWIIQDLDTEAKSAALYASDTTLETVAFDPVLAMYTINAFIDVCAVSYAVNQNPATSIDTTTLCDAEKTSLVGFRDPGTLTFDFFIDPTDPDYLALQDAYDDGLERMFEIVYRNGAVRTLPVIVQSINETGGVDQAVKGAATMKITGSPVLTQPKIAPVAAYVVSAAVAPANGVAPLTVTITLTEQNGAASKFAIDWADGGAVEELIGSKTTTHDYIVAGAYTASVVATVGGIAKPAVLAAPVTVS
jgi:PKD repeat protein